MRHAFALLGVLTLTQLSCIVTTTGGGNFARAYTGNIPLTLVNDTGAQACYVHMGPSNNPYWGDDWLGPSEIIQPGAARTFMVAGAPGWDIQVQNCQHMTFAQAQHLPVMGPMQLPISQLHPGAVVQPVYVQPQQQPQQVYVQPQGAYAAPPPVYVR